MRKTWTVKDLSKRWGTPRSTTYSIVHRDGFPWPIFTVSGVLRWYAEEIIAWEKKVAEAGRGGER